jgi:uncharacterized protein YwgA
MNRQQIGLKLTLNTLGLPLALDTFADRMVIQKTIYLCQMAGIHLGYRYNWYLRGPYSPDLTRDAFELNAKQDSWFDEATGSKLDDTSIKILNSIDPLWSGTSSANLPRRLELLASVLFLKRSYDGRNKDVTGLREILAKNEKFFSEEEVRQALEELVHYGFSVTSSI